MVEVFGGCEFFNMKIKAQFHPKSLNSTPLKCIQEAFLLPIPLPLPLYLCLRFHSNLLLLKKQTGLKLVSREDKIRRASFFLTLQDHTNEGFIPQNSLKRYLLYGGTERDREGCGEVWRVVYTTPYSTLMSKTPQGTFMVGYFLIIKSHTLLSGYLTVLLLGDSEKKGRQADELNGNKTVTVILQN